MGDEFSHAHAACLAAQLPKGARCRIADDPHEEWSREAWTLWRIDHAVNLLRWCFLKYDGEAQPEPIPYPGAELDRAIKNMRLKSNMRAVGHAFGMEEGGEDDN